MPCSVSRLGISVSGCSGAVYLASLLVMSTVLSTAIAERAPWKTAHVRGTPTAPLPYQTERVFGKTLFQQPVVLTNAPGTNSMFLLELHGKIFELPSEDCEQPLLIADLKKTIPNLLMAYGLAFHPQFATNREIYVCYKRTGERENGTIVCRLKLTDAQPMEVSPNSQEIFYTWRSGGHNGGCVKFGPDGFLYVSAGDAADPFPPDPFRAGQNVGSLLSTIMRIDVDARQGELPYRIPDDNPFIDLPGARPEVYAYGFRNPWRMAFDRVTGALWVGDVGWELWEMIHLVKAGGNYGWSISEGPHGVNRDVKVGPTPLQKPVFSHPHSEARSITGGQVYYGDRLPELKGAYIYGDHVTGRIWSLRAPSGERATPVELARAALQIICFGLHNNGEVYIVDYVGSIHRLVRRAPSKAETPFPHTLTQTGLFQDVPQHTLAPGVLPYSVIAEPWMDNATAKRFVAIPDDQKIGVYQKGGGHANWDGKHRGSWKFPTDSVLGKTIALEGQAIETQLMHFDGQAWQPYTYLWNAEQTDAVLAEDTTQIIEVDLGERRQPWQVSNRTECMVCHSNANGMLLGFKPYQLRTPTSDGSDQLEELYQLGLFEQAPPHTGTLTNPQDANAPLAHRARSYLHVNCAHCHRREGGGAVAMNVVYDVAEKETGILDQAPLQGSFGLPNALVVASGDPYRSVLLYRFAKHGPGHMPKLGGLEVDQRGAVLLHDWITSLGTRDQQRKAQIELQNILGQFSHSDDAALQENLTAPRTSQIVSHALRTHQFTGSQQTRLLKLVRRLPDTAQDIYQPFVPYAQRIKRLGSQIDVNDLLAEPGSVEQGRQLFLSESLTCKNCHEVQPGRESIGPNLAQLQSPRYAKRELLQSILQPSDRIDEAFQTLVVQTVDGRVFTGVGKSSSTTMTLRTAQNKTHTIPLADIEFQKNSEVSIMPEKLLETLTLEQARNLLAFLHSLRDQNNAGD